MRVLAFSYKKLGSIDRELDMMHARQLTHPEAIRWLIEGLKAQKPNRERHMSEEKALRRTLPCGKKLLIAKGRLPRNQSMCT